MAVQIIITNAGRAALVNAQNLGTNPVLITEVGLTATAVTPTASTTALTGEFKRLSTMSGAVVADDTIHLTVRDESNETYSVRSFGLYLADGTLFAVYGQAALLVQKSTQSIMLLAVDVKFADIAATSLTFGDTDFLNPPATKTAQGVVELATEAEVISGTDDVRAVTPKDNKAAHTNWLNARFGEAAPTPLLKNILAMALVADVRTALGLKNAALKDEGVGGGLNADLLDGQHGAYYADIAARLGFTPLNAATYTAADVLAKLLTVDGAGSGIDADLLDGQQAAYYTNIAARLGFTPLNAATYTAADIRTKLLTVDGAGSGIDADLLDGQQAAYYTDIAARLGFTPLNAAAYTAADVLAKLLTVGGTGSGLDADKLDGQDAAYFTNIIARLGFTPLNTTAYTAADVLAKLLTVDGAGSGIDADRLDGQHGAYYADIAARLGFTPLNAATYTAADVLAKLLTVDGAGSGIDADLLDGMNASDFTALASFTGTNQLLAANGYQKLPGGMIIQSGRLSISSNASVTITWPVAFPTDCLAAVANSGEVDSARNENQAAFYDWKAANGRIYNGLDKTNAARWIAIGY